METGTTAGPQAMETGTTAGLLESCVPRTAEGLASVLMMAGQSVQMHGAVLGKDGRWREAKVQEAVLAAGSAR